MTSYSRTQVIGWQSCRGIQNLTDTAVKIALVLTTVAALPPTLAALVIAAGSVGGALAALPAGALADRFDSRKLLQVALASETFLAVVGGISLIISPGFVLLTVLAIALGAVNTIANTAFSCLPVQVVPKEALSATLATGQGIGRVAGIVGAPLGAVASVWTGQSFTGFGSLLLAHAAGVVLCFVGVTHWVQIRYPKSASARSLRSSITSGPVEVCADHQVRRLVVCLVGSNVWVGPVTALGVAVAFTTTGVTTVWVGICQAALGFAAFAATLAVGKIGAPRAAYGLIILAVQGLALIGIGFGKPWLSVVCMTIVGVTAGIASISVGRELVTVTPSELFGRAIALIQGIDMVLTPLSFIVFGWMTQTFGAHVATTVYGVCACVMFISSASTYVARNNTSAPSPDAVATTDKPSRTANPT